MEYVAVYLPPALTKGADDVGIRRSMARPRKGGRFNIERFPLQELPGGASIPSCGGQFESEGYASRIGRLFVGVRA